MAIVKKGDTSVRIISTNFVFDPRYGTQVEITYLGLQAAVTNIGAAAVATGGRARVTQRQGPVYEAVATWGAAQDGSAEVPVDRWERVTEYVQEDFKRNPLMIQTFGNTQTISQYVNEIKDDLAAKPPTGLPAYDSDVTGKKRNLYDLVAMGTQAHEVKRLVLRRRRTISLALADPNTVNAVESVYTTAKVVAVFQVPGSIAVKLPADPAVVPPGCIWAWKERQDNSQDTPWYNKSEGIRDWVFAAWSTLLYNVVS